MKTKEQIEARLKIAQEEIATWVADLNNEKKKAIQIDQDEKYIDYCRSILRELKGQRTILEWILHP